MEKRIKDLEEQRDAYHAYDLAYDAPDCIDYKRGCSEYEFLNRYKDGNFSDHENATHWFGRDKNEPGKLYLNGIARSIADKLVVDYQSILEEMRETDKEGQVTGQKYLEYQLSWFGKEYDIENDITLANKDKARNELVELLEFHVTNSTHIIESEDFRKEFTLLYDKVFQREDRNLGRLYGKDKINKLLEKQGMGYKVESKSDSKSGKAYWIIDRCNLESVTDKS